MTQIIRDGRELFGLNGDEIYNAIGKLPPGLIVDVGAAVGVTVQKALRSSPENHAIAFEPFPGNWPFLDERLGELDNVKIVHQAVADKKGEAPFYVPSIAAEKGIWTKFSGYSSVGALVPESSPKSSDPGTTVVPVTTIDEHVSEPIRFLKIDVQGGEAKVLAGASDALQRGVDLMLVEFSGDQSVLDILFSHDYDIYDGEYLVVPMEKEVDVAEWEVTETKLLSTGQTGYFGWPIERPSDPESFCRFFKEARARGVLVQTDLQVVDRSVLKYFEQ